MILAPYIQKYKTHKYFKHFLVSASLLLIYFAYKIYIWSHTQSTDNAYLDADVSLVACEINGVVKNVLIKDNQKVSCGDIIAEINDEDFQSNLAKAEADMSAATHAIEVIDQQILIEQINLEKNKELQALTKSSLDITETDYKRSSELSRDNYMSKKLLDNARITYEKARSEYSQRTLDVQVNEQNLLSNSKQKLAKQSTLESLVQAKNLATRALENTKVRAPVDGMLANSSLKVGNYVRSGVVLFAVVPHTLYVKANFKETQVAKFKGGMTAELKFDSAPKVRVIGKIRNISPATGSKFSLLPPDNATGNFTKVVQRVPVLIDFELPAGFDGNLMPGMSTLVDIRTD